MNMLEEDDGRGSRRRRRSKMTDDLPLRAVSDLLGRTIAPGILANLPPCSAANGNSFSWANGQGEVIDGQRRHIFFLADA